METLYELHHHPHLRLSIQQESDAAEIFALVQQEKPRLRRTLPWPDSVTHIDDSLNTIKTNRHEFAAGIAAVYIIRWDDVIAGIVSFNTIQDREGEIGYWIAEKFEGKGIVSLSVRTMIDAYMNAGRVRRCIIKASVENPRSNALAQRLGFRFYGQKKGGEKLGDRRIDQNVYHYQV
ncbi:GNAT family N-acetyltransferase [Brenneria goodwinii]|uniref:Ribosomal-protein-L7p-serine acetyltransferase n=1 Tax=Brenneria goodwinii TaxID=1109412 RepID=A0A0G4JXX2_9GAMM|nr:GNAT family N-acetyltransferase [Brenneria goodwinii]MCG8157497.1 GNAT family N-acetyltransferase [Brenneria goodwinii]MCG8162070.1 GNAT family N-acetyltransferase [Brenneria goodwinii]MCG8165311.1 GNAT family N-acetyltransferase [Brenneria goodwinii]MCG8171008.1 GNAT family N-acetyltransferase [Brenneria goodwinii]MCG8176026.1 GNAT family N-acetyltransferase [Brenneria goodwinii]